MASMGTSASSPQLPKVLNFLGWVTVAQGKNIFLHCYYSALHFYTITINFSNSPNLSSRYVCIYAKASEPPSLFFWVCPLIWKA